MNQKLLMREKRGNNNRAGGERPSSTRRSPNPFLTCPRERGEFQGKSKERGSRENFPVERGESRLPAHEGKKRPCIKGRREG